jgi:hypothetical protein
MSTAKQLKLKLAQKKEKSAKLTAANKILKDEMKLIADQLKALKEQGTVEVKKPVVAKKKK